jgi:hypothetical protein
MDISVVILSWNDKQHLDGLLKSLANSTGTRSMEIIVVDNASTDGSPEMVETEFPGVKLIKNKENLGFPKGNNVGVMASRGKYVYLLNSDIKVLDGCIDALADYLDQNPRVGMVGPKILNRDMTHQSSCRTFPTLWNNFCSAAGLAKAFAGSKFFSGEHMMYFKGDRTLEVDVLVGCFWAVRREAIDQFGLLDEGFFIYAEDVDWCKRCWKAGHPLPGGQHDEEGSRALRLNAATLGVALLEKASWHCRTQGHELPDLCPPGCALGGGLDELSGKTLEARRQPGADAGLWRVFTGPLFQHYRGGSRIVRNRTVDAILRG